jgi:hypothetical protein
MFVVAIPSYVFYIRALLIDQACAHAPGVYQVPEARFSDQNLHDSVIPSRVILEGNLTGDAGCQKSAIFLL